MRTVLSAAIAIAALAGAARADRSDKPGAPVVITTATATAADGSAVVTVDAVVTRDVPALELRVGGEVARFGATPRGTHRQLAVRVAVPTDGMDLVATAAIGTGTRLRTRTIGVRLGPRPAPRAYTVRAMKGRAVAEVRR